MSCSKTDEELKSVIHEIQKIDPKGERIARVLRSTLDQLYDGQHTGRYRWDQLHKTEKTHCGTLVEINLHREFEFEDGKDMDYQISGIEVDCKYSQSLYGWMIPLEAVGHLCILLSANDESSRWSMGIVRISTEILNQGRNRDSKRNIGAHGRDNIVWIFKDAELKPNILLQLPRDTVEAIMDLPTGQKRINEIFRVAQGKVIGRGVIATLGQQEDYMKRVRGNGGSRGKLKSEGIIILGQYERHRQIAKELGLPIPDKGESVSIRVAPANSPGQGVVGIEDKLWRIAKDDDPICDAPEVPYY
ncbi:restriction endonuclease [Gimesia chilikensis]|uniref:NaeI family type II restriction endonuclease n=1 Tax=Gimesia chilikensis TaxID=2605989 RepID=UPI0011ED9AF6|nr:NaeI family type II restriction endonuclease [Gimesia chilikensis]KAA0141016.1 restriction endonuclease [Gimesia chilikensis]